MSNRTTTRRQQVDWERHERKRLVIGYHLLGQTTIEMVAGEIETLNVTGAFSQ